MNRRRSRASSADQASWPILGLGALRRCHSKSMDPPGHDAGDKILRLASCPIWSAMFLPSQTPANETLVEIELLVGFVGYPNMT
ncbi:hypothetical protein HYQ46_007736 [Verticillium longisporum]|nr:hypothetical protein HYQ46_007736 [Verticillium longisporum]